jgi:hypothetical protein
MSYYPPFKGDLPFAEFFEDLFEDIFDFIDLLETNTSGIFKSSEEFPSGKTY